MELRHTTNSRGNRHGLLVRVLAIFFLLYTGTDIASPQLCSEELLGLSGEVQAVELTPVNNGSAHSNAAVAVVTTPENSQKDRSSNQSAQDEDCFCCCAHVLPGMMFVTISNFDLKSPAVSVKHNSLPTPPHQSTYHPPRFA